MSLLDFHHIPHVIFKSCKSIHILYGTGYVKLRKHFQGIYEKLMFDTPAFYTGKKFFCRLREDGETLVLYTNDRDEWIDRNPEVFFFTDHYKNSPILLIDLKNVSTKDLEKLLINSWKIRATKTLLKGYGK